MSERVRKQQVKMTSLSLYLLLTRQLAGPSSPLLQESTPSQDLLKKTCRNLWLYQSLVVGPSKRGTFRLLAPGMQRPILPTSFLDVPWEDPTGQPWSGKFGAMSSKVLLRQTGKASVCSVVCYCLYSFYNCFKFPV